MNDRHTITINNEAYQKLKGKGIFGESYSQLILRIADADTKSHLDEGQQ